MFQCLVMELYISVSYISRMCLMSALSIGAICKNIALTILIGCGKRTVVRYVARRLGLHVVEYSCHDLMTSSERKTSAALASAFSMANRYSLYIILY